MGTTSVGAAAMASLATADGGVSAFDASTGYIGVGNDGTAFSAAQTDLLGTKVRKAVTAVTGTFPSAQRVYTASFTTAEANFEWLEVGLFNAASSGQMLCRKVISLGTKPGTESWTVNLEVTFVAA